MSINIKKVGIVTLKVLCIIAMAVALLVSYGEIMTSNGMQLREVGKLIHVDLSNQKLIYYQSNGIPDTDILYIVQIDEKCLDEIRSNTINYKNWHNGSPKMIHKLEHYDGEKEVFTYEELTELKDEQNPWYFCITYKDYECYAIVDVRTNKLFITVVSCV